MLLFPAPGTQALTTCPAGVYPLLSSPSLHIDDQAARRLLAQRHLAANCRDLAADLAQLFYWGAGDTQPDLTRAWHFAQLSKRDGRLHSPLRVLAGAFSLAGLNKSMTAAEALRRFDRELRADDTLRRDKAFAVLNQLQFFLPRVALNDRPLFLDARRSEPAPDAWEGLVLNARLGLLLVPDRSGAPAMRWVGAPPETHLRPLAEADNAAPLLTAHSVTRGSNRNLGYRELFFPRGESRQARRWQRWDRHSPSGVLYSGFGFESGSYKESRCTATAIGARWLVTAAHCLFASDRDIQRNGRADLEVMRFASRHGEGSIMIDVDAAWIHHLHRPQDLAANRLAAYSGSDVAVLRLALPREDPAVMSLASLAGREDIQVRSSGFPKDKSSVGAWINHCRAGLVRNGEGGLMDLYAMSCDFSVGQSGSLMTAREDRRDAGPPPGAAVGVLSANLSTANHKSAIFAAFSDELIRDIANLQSAGAAPQYLVPFPIADASLVAASDADK